jgi:DNA-binding transcriptional MerR regulator
MTTIAQANIPTDKEIEQVCEWLQIYQYYSHINIIIKCIETFHILPVENDDELIGHLKHLQDENCSLKEITQAYRILKQQFQKLRSQHLQLIKTAVECSGVVQLMKKSDLYSPHGRRRFQELRDNLTTQFQFQERNNIILNSCIIVYELCQPFVLRATNFDEFIDRIARLLNFEENSIKHMQSKTSI